MYHPDPTRGDVGQIIPASQFVQPDGRTPGLAGEYFLGADFQKPVLSRADTAIVFDWGIKSPASEIRPDSFSMRWTGKLLTTRAGKYRFTTLADDGVRLLIAGKLVLEDWRQHAPEYHSGEIDLPANAAMDFRFEFYEAIGGASVKLHWTEPKTAKELAAEKAVDPNAVQTRLVVLPHGTVWTDFWTGKTFTGGRTIQAEAPIDILPLYARAGSLLPLGPEMQYATEKPEDPVELE